MKTALLFLMLALPLQAEDWTVNGKDYHNVKVGQVEADRVHISYDGGIGTILLSDLPPDLKKRFAYNPEQSKEAAEAREQAQAKANQELAKEMAIDEQQKAPPETKPTMRLIGTVQQTFDDGCLVEVTFGADTRQMIANQDYGSWRAVGGGGYSPYDAANGVKPSGQKGNGKHYSEDSLTTTMGSSPSKPKIAPPLPAVPDGLYFLSGMPCTVGQKIDSSVYRDEPVKAADGQRYQHLVTQ